MNGQMNEGTRTFWGFFYLCAALVLLMLLVANKAGGHTIIRIHLEPGIVPVVMDLLLFFWAIRFLSGGPIRRL